MFFVLWIVKVVVRQPAPSSFEQQNTKQLSEISLSPYFKSTKIFYKPLVWNVKPERQHHLSIVFQSLLPFGFKPTLILDNAIVVLDILFLANILRIILIGVPTSPQLPT